MKSSPSDAKPDELYGELASLPALGPERLKERWRILYGTEPPPSSRCRAGPRAGTGSGATANFRRKDIRAIARSSIVCRSNSLPCRLSLYAVEQSKRPRHYSVQQRPLWADSREDSYPHQDAQ